MGQQFHVKVKFINGACKNHDTCALAGSPIDFVSLAGFVMVHYNLKSGFNLSCKVFLVMMSLSGLTTCPSEAGRQLTKPSVLWAVLLNLII
jgi:hypothetical protein